MKTYFIRRILALLPMFFMMTGLYFCLQNYLPGGPVQETLARIKGMGDEKGSRTLSADDLKKLKHDLEIQYGLDKPILARYFIWVKNILTLDFGESITTRAPALDQIKERLPISLAFGIPGFFLTYLVCIPLGVFLAIKDGTRFDALATFLLFLFYSIPSLIFAILFLLIFCTDRVLPHGALFPLGGWRSDHYADLSTFQRFLDIVHHLFLPVLASLMSNFTILTFLQKNSFLEVMRSEYIRTARAKGLSEKAVMLKHALRNALLPMTVGFGSLLGAFLGGSLIIEPIFGLPGLGVLSLQAISSRDYNVIMAIIVLQSIAILLGQLLSDVCAIFVDPRIKYK
jgi:microcin C transport system permease protein